MSDAARGPQTAEKHLIGNESPSHTDTQTISDFGAQWSQFTSNAGYYGSVGMLRDIVEPLYPLASLRGKRVAEIGSGTGRIVNMLLDAGADHVLALEPSDAFTVLLENTGARHDRITYVRAGGEALPVDDPFDAIFCIGVIHHIKYPRPIIERAFLALKSGGHLIVWVYAREGNRLYLSFALPLRAVTKHLPDFLLRCMAHLMAVALRLYIRLCRYLPLPMRDYMLNVLGKYDFYALKLTVFDQLNPAYSKYYPGAEAEDLLISAGFSAVRKYHRHGYSWTVVGQKP